MIGVYIITNLLNNKSYIGLSKNIEKRIQEHFNRAFRPNDKEYEKSLYRAIRKYGRENFSQKVLEECSLENLKEKEIFWISKFDTYANGYNETIGGEIGNMQFGGNHSRAKLTTKDVIDIRRRYNLHERHMDVYKLYSHKIQKNGFGKVWRGESWKHLMMEIYTENNKKFHRNNLSMKGSINGMAKLTEKDVLDIRKRKSNGELSLDIYKTYEQKLTYKSFYNVYAGYNWKHLKI